MTNATNGIMAHLIAFYPDEDRSLAVARALMDGGAKYLELQFPFSEPTADGPAIQRACARALSLGFTLEAGFRLLSRVCGLSEAPVFVMSYANPVYRGGVKEFVKRCRDAGARGLIVPDLPADCDEGMYAAAAAAGMEAIPVVVPTITQERLELIKGLGTGYLYVALRRGITGAKTEIGEENLSFLSRVSRPGLKILAGFGISDRAQVEALAPKVHAVIVGSAFVEAAENDDGTGSPYPSVLAKMKSLA
jgi:tryptophan synthase alpha chain